MKWKKIKDFPDYYVSDTGLIKSKKKILKPIKHTTKRKHNYFFVSLYKNGQQKAVSISRLVARAFIPNPYNKPNIDHINRNTTDNSVKNLRWVTQSENLLNKNTVKYRSMMIKNKKAVDVAIENGVSKETFYRRIRNGWSIKKASSILPKKYAFINRKNKRS